MNGQAGKGDRYRPVDHKKWSENYDRIFRKKDHVTVLVKQHEENIRQLKNLADKLQSALDKADQADKDFVP